MAEVTADTIRVRLRPLAEVTMVEKEVYGQLYCVLPVVMAEAVEAGGHGYRRREVAGEINRATVGDGLARVARILHNHSTNAQGCNKGCRYLDYVAKAEPIGEGEVPL